MMASGPKLPRPPQGSKPVSVTEFVPFLSAKISILRSRLMLPGAITIAASLLLFGLLPNVGSSEVDITLFVEVLGSYLIFILLWVIYAYTETDKPIAALAFPIVVVAFLMLFKPVFATLSFVFGDVLPGRVSDNAGFAARLVGHFFGAGLPEELLKAVPTLFGLFLTLRSGMPKHRLLELIRVRGPLDGLVFGVAAGAAFTFIETIFIYVDRFGFFVLFPRVLSFSGHMAYSGIFGYFIGLAAIRSAVMPQLLLAGWLGAATLHALWDASGSLGGLSFAALAAFLCFVACLLKARQLEGKKSHLASGPDGSIVVGSSTARAPSQTATSSLLQPEGQASRVRESTFQLLVEGRIIPLQPGLRLELGKLPGLVHAKGIVVGVTTHPKDASIMGLQNLGERPWTAVYQGAPKQIDPQRNIRVSHGTLIAFGPVQGSIQEIGPT
jgi:RsiW-degrading membrane proteinase PrsW (M82 family)